MLVELFEASQNTFEATISSTTNLVSLVVNSSLCAPSATLMFPDLVECDGPGEAVVARAEGVVLADDQHPAEARKVFHQARLDLFYRGVRRDIP